MEIVRATTVDRLVDHLSTPPGEAEVAQGEWRSSIGSLGTLSVASCIVLAAHNTTTRRGMLGHFSSISPTARSNPRLSQEHFDTEAYDEAIAFMPDLGPVQETWIWLGGSALYAADAASIKESKLADRRYAETKIDELSTLFYPASPRIIRDWNTTEQELYIRLECRSGMLLIQPVAE